MTIRVRRALPVLLAGSLFASHALVSAAQPAPRLERSAMRADDGHLLTVWSKHGTRTTRGAILLLHGRTWSSLPNFDLHAGGRSASLMDALAADGYAVYALDQRGYGATPRDSSGWLTPARAARDASEVLVWIAKREASAGREFSPPALFGYSRGSLTAALVAQTYPDRMSALILYGFPLKRAPFANAPSDSTAPRRAPTSLADAGSDFITPGTPAPEIKTAYQRSAVAADAVRVDWKDEGEFAALNGNAIHVPVMLLNGERDPNVINSRDAEFFAQLGGVDRAWVILANADHVAHLERTADFVHAIVGFLDKPAARK